MAITLRAKKAVAITGATTASSISLTSGWNTSFGDGNATYTPAQNDIVIVTYAVGSTSDQALSVTTGYTQLAELNSPDNEDANLVVSLKRMSGTPDTTVSVSGSGSSQNARAVIVEVWSGVDTTTAMDVAVVTATGADTSRPNAAAITPTTAGAVVIVCAGSSAPVTPVAYAQSGSELSNFLSIGSADTRSSVAGSGSFAWTSGAFDPVAWVGSSTSTALAWAAVTLALRPDTTTVLSLPLLDAAPVLHAPTVIYDVTLDVPLLDASATLYAPTVTAGDAILELPLLDATPALYAPTIGVGPVILAPPLLDASPTLYAPTVTPGAVTLAPPLLDAAPVLYSPTVSVGAVTLSLPLLDATPTLYAPSVGQVHRFTTFGSSMLGFGPLASGPIASTTLVTAAAADGTLSLPLLDATPTLHAPTVTPGAVTLSLPLLTSEPTLFAPEITNAFHIKFIGSHVEAAINGADITVNFSSLLDESGGTPTVLEDDVVVVVYAVASSTTGDVAMSISDAGWTEIDELYVNGSQDANLAAYTKVMGASPDTSVTVVGTGLGSESTACAVFVFRNVDTTNILDVAHVTATGSASPNADPPAITPVTDGAWIFCAGTGAFSTGAAPDDYGQTGLSTGTNHFRTVTIQATLDVVLGAGFKSDWTSGSYDQGAFTSSNSGAGTRWAAITLALRPFSPNVSLSLPLLDDTPTLYTPTITPGAVTVSPPLLTSEPVLYAPSVSMVVAPPLLDAAPTLFAPTVTPGAVTLSVPLLDASATLYAPTVTLGAVTLDVPLLDATPVLYAPTVTPGAVTLDLPLLDATPTLLVPSVTVGTVTLDLPLLDASATLYAPTIQPGGVTLDLPLLDASATLYAPTVTPGAVALSLPLLDATPVLYEPDVTTFGSISIPRINNLATLFAPTITTSYDISLPLLDAAPTLFPLELQVSSIERRLRLGDVDRSTAVSSLVRSVTVPALNRSVTVAPAASRVVTAPALDRSLEQGSLERAA